MDIKIRGSQTSHDETPLCVTCRWATIIRGRGLQEEIVECGQLSRNNRIVFPVISCSGYSDRRHASIREMEEIAWVLRSDPNKKKIGFVRASDLRPRERYVLAED